MKHEEVFRREEKFRKEKEQKKVTKCKVKGNIGSLVPVITSIVIVIVILFVGQLILGQMQATVPDLNLDNTTADTLTNTFTKGSNQLNLTLNFMTVIIIVTLAGIVLYTLLRGFGQAAGGGGQERRS